MGMRVTLADGQLTRGAGVAGWVGGGWRLGGACGGRANYLHSQGKS